MEALASTVLSQMDAVTNDYFIIDGGKAADRYFEQSFNLNYFLKQQKGIWKRPSGGEAIRIPFRYDGNTAGFYARGGVLSSDKVDAITAVFFNWKHAYSNGTVYRIDELKNAGPEGLINLTTEEVYGAQESISKTLADSFYDAPGGASTRLTGLRNLCNETSTLDYGNIAEDDIVASDGTTKPWEGKVTSTAETINLDVIRDLRSTAEYGSGSDDEPKLIVTTKAIYNTIKSILQLQQRFTEKDSEPVKAGFQGVHFEGAEIYPDKFCPSGWMFALNPNHFGFAVHKQGLFMRTPWAVIEGSPQDKTMKILFDGNTVCNNRRAHAAHSNLSA